MELFFIAAYVVKRAPEEVLGNKTVFKLLDGEEVNSAHLRAIDARPFMHIETHIKNLEDKAWERKLCCYNPDSKAYLIFNPAKRDVIESRNLVLIDTPNRVLPLLEERLRLNFIS